MGHPIFHVNQFIQSGVHESPFFQHPNIVNLDQQVVGSFSQCFQFHVSTILNRRLCWPWPGLNLNPSFLFPLPLASTMTVLAWPFMNCGLFVFFCLFWSLLFLLVYAFVRFWFFNLFFLVKYLFLKWSKFTSITYSLSFFLFKYLIWML